MTETEVELGLTKYERSAWQWCALAFALFALVSSEAGWLGWVAVSAVGAAPVLRVWWLRTRYEYTRSGS